MRNRAWSEDVSAVMSPSPVRHPGAAAGIEEVLEVHARQVVAHLGGQTPGARNTMIQQVLGDMLRRRSHLRCVRAGAVTAAGRGVWLVRNSPLGHTR